MPTIPEADEQLRLGTDAFRSLDGSFPGSEYPRDSVRFGQQRRVTHREAQPDAEFLRATYNISWFCNDHECHAIAKEYPGEQDKA